MLRSRLLLPLLALPLLVAPAAIAQNETGSPQKSFGEVVRATAVTVTLDVRDATGAVPAELSAGDFVVVEDGQEMLVLAVERAASAGANWPPAGVGSSAVVLATALAAPAEASASKLAPAPREDWAQARNVPWQVVLYFDGPTATIPTIQGAAAELAARAGDLAALGSVEVIVANPSPMRVAGPTRDASELAAALEHLAQEGVGSNEIARLRREFVAAADADNLDELTRSRQDPTPPRQAGTPGGGSQGVLDRTNSARGGGATTLSGASGLQRRMLTRTSAQREFQVLAHQRNQLTAWLALVQRPRRPHALVFVSDGFDLDPSEFYLSYLRDATLVSQTRADLEKLRSGSEFEKMARAVAASGWQVMPISLGLPGGEIAGAADASGRGRFRRFMRDARSEAPGTGLSQFLLRAPMDPLRTMAEESGGDLSLTTDQIGTNLAGLAERVRLTYQVPRDPDGAVHQLDVRSRREGWTVRAPHSVSAAAPDSMMAARARHVLGTANAQGSSLTLAAELAVMTDPTEPDAALFELTYDVDLTSLRSERESLDAGDLRVTLVVELPDGRILVSQSRPTSRVLSADFHYVAREQLRVPKGTRRLAVAVDDTTSGAWGAAAVEPRG